MQSIDKKDNTQRCGSELKKSVDLDQRVSPCGTLDDLGRNLIIDCQQAFARKASLRSNILLLAPLPLRCKPCMLPCNPNVLVARVPLATGNVEAIPLIQLYACSLVSYRCINDKVKGDSVLQDATNSNQ